MQKAVYLKVSVTVFKFIVPNNVMHKEWVDRRKHKQIVLQDFRAINPTLKFFDNAGDVVDKT